MTTIADVRKTLQKWEESEEYREACGTLSEGWGNVSMTNFIRQLLEKQEKVAKIDLFNQLYDMMKSGGEDPIDMALRLVMEMNKVRDTLIKPVEK